MQAHGVTLFLDEVGEMDLALQSKLLRFLQTKTVQRVGEEGQRNADVRIVCATNRDPQAEVAAGRFREDLFYRLHVVPVELPPLRERDQDVLLIGRHFLEIFAKEDGKSFRNFSPEVEAAMLTYSWPGNVRQLQNVVRSIVVLHDGESVTLDMLPREMHMTAAAPPLAIAQALSQPLVAPEPITPTLPRAEPESAEIKPLEDVIRSTIERAIELSDGSIPRAAAALRVSPSTLYRRIQGWHEAETQA
jgi:two-component system repressor protein LuxO